MPHVTMAHGLTTLLEFWTF